MIKALTIERKERIKPHSPGNYPDPKLSPMTDKVRIVFGFTEIDGGKLVEFPMVVTPEEARPVDVGDIVHMKIDLIPVRHSEDVMSERNESRTSEEVS